MSDLRYIVAAYAVSWIVLLGYGAYLAARKHATDVEAARQRTGGSGV